MIGVERRLKRVSLLVHFGILKMNS